MHELIMITTKNGKTQYRDKTANKIISKTLYENLMGGTEDGVKSETVAPPAPVVTIEPTPQAEKTCIFCGEYGDSSKFINLRTVYLCEQDYLSKTSGEIVQRVREMNEG